MFVLRSNETQNNYFSIPNINDSHIQSLKNLYSSSVIMQMLEKQKEYRLQSTVIFTDIHESWDSERTRQKRIQLDRICQQFVLPRVSISGQSFNATLKEFKLQEFPAFDVIVASGGAEIYVLQNNHTLTDYKLDYVYKELYIESRHWNKEEYFKRIDTLIKTYKELYPRRCLILQDRDEPPEEFRINCHFFAASNTEREEVVSDIQQQFPSSKIIVSEEKLYKEQIQADEWPKKYCLDICAVDKLSPVIYLSSLLNIHQGCVIGNAGNDLAFIINTPELPAILVGDFSLEAIIEIEKYLTLNSGHPISKMTTPDGKVKEIYIEKRKNKIATESVVYAMMLYVDRALKSVSEKNLREYLLKLKTALSPLI